MKSNWPQERFGDVCCFVRGPFGGSLKKSIFKEEGYAVYEQQHAINDQFSSIRYFVDQNKFDEMSRFELVSGDLIMSCSGTMGKVAIAPEGIPRGIINQALLKISPKGKLLPCFLKLLMESRNFQEQIEALSQGAAIKNMASVKILKEIKVPVPLLETQKNIVAKLDQAFAELEKAKANAEQNLVNAKELFDSYLQKVFSQEGDGWVETCVGNEINLLTGNAFKSKEYVTHSDSVKLLRGDNIMQGYFRWDGAKYWPNDRVDEFEKFLLLEGDIVLAMDRTWVKAGMKFAKITKSELPCLLLQRVARLRCKESMDKDLLYFLMGSKLFESYVLSIQTGLGVPHISGKQIQSFVFSKPNIGKQKEISCKLNSLSQEVKKLELVYIKKIKALGELKQSILQKAFNGELA